MSKGKMEAQRLDEAAIVPNVFLKLQTSFTLLLDHLLHFFTARGKVEINLIIST